MRRDAAASRAVSANQSQQPVPGTARSPAAANRARCNWARYPILRCVVGRDPDISVHRRRTETTARAEPTSSGPAHFMDSTVSNGQGSKPRPRATQPAAAAAAAAGKLVPLVATRFDDLVK